jgi:hypothetical protein
VLIRLKVTELPGTGIGVCCMVVFDAEWTKGMTDMTETSRKRGSCLYRLAHGASDRRDEAKVIKQ